MKRSSLVGLLAAGGLVLTGCSSGTTTTASTTAASTTAASASTNSAAGSSAAGDTTEAAAAELDSVTETWFSTFCTSLADIGQYTSPDTAGQSLDEQQATVVTAYTGISTEAAKAATALKAAAPPTITSGEEIAAATTTGFQGLADVYGKGAQTIAALTPASENDLKTAVDEVETEAKAAAPQSLAELDPGVEAAVKALPECAAVVG